MSLGKHNFLKLNISLTSCKTLWISSVSGFHETVRQTRQLFTLNKNALLPQQRLSAAPPAQDVWLSDCVTKTSWSWTLVLPLAKHCEFLECLVFMKLSDKYDTFPHTIKHTAPTTKTFCSSSSSRLVEKGPNFDPFLLSLFPYPFHKGTNCPCYHNRQASPVLSPSLTLGTHAQRGL